jgi:5-methylcytosine-specific restriction endonuclease McrA
VHIDNLPMRVIFVILLVISVIVYMNQLTTNKRKSIIWEIPTKELQDVINRSSSIKEVLNYLGLQGVTGGNRDTLAKRIAEDGLILTELYQNRDLKEDLRRKKYQWDRQVSNEDLFVLNSNSGRSTVRRRILIEKLIPYRCSDCANEGSHNGKPLSLQLDHINGINNDNRLENLRFLCPNCHSQTGTYAGKKDPILCSCGNKMHKKSKHCKKCSVSIPKRRHHIQ